PGPALRQAPTDQSLPGTVLLSGALEPQVDRCAGPDELAFYYSEAGSTNVAPQLRRRVVGLEGAVVSNVEVYADDILDSQTFRSGGACGGHAAVLRQGQRGEPERTSASWVEISQGARTVTYAWPDGAQAWIDALAVAEDYVAWLVYEGYAHAPTRYVHRVGRGE